MCIWLGLRLELGLGLGLGLGLRLGLGLGLGLRLRLRLGLRGIFGSFVFGLNDVPTSWFQSDWFKLDLSIQSPSCALGTL